MSFLNYVIIFALGGGVVYGLTKKEPTQKHKNIKELNQLQTDNNSLEIDKLNLQNRNSNLVNIIAENQRSIKNLQKNSRELKEDFTTIIRHQVTILELLSNVTKIRDQADINAQIVVTKDFAKKYNLFLGSSQALPPINNLDVYESD